MNWIFLTHLGFTLYMTGVIWFVQIVHYPLMGKVGAEYFVAYERSHTMLTTFVVGPQMVIELATAVLLVFSMKNMQSWWWINLALVGAVWASTFFIQVPLHNDLSQGFDEVKHLKLVNSNWIRTVVWTARAVLLLFLAKSLV
jgi:hypothetical protein